MRAMTGRLGSMLGVLGVLLALLGGCGATAPVHVELSDYAIKLTSSTLKAGDVTLAIRNTGAATHELVVVQTDLGFSQLPVASDGNADENDLKGMGEVENIEAGMADNIKLNLPPGHYMLLCNLPGHFADGMHAEFVVTE
jgi:uncharacterized cupredoxin-like copper-binding protein